MRVNSAQDGGDDMHSSSKGKGPSKVNESKFYGDDEEAKDFEAILSDPLPSCDTSIADFDESDTTQLAHK